MICMYKIAVLGDRDSIFGFAALGLETVICDSGEDASLKLRKMSADDYAVIYITDKLAELAAEEIEKLSESVLPAVILIPGVSGNTGRGIGDVKKSVEQAVGSDIIFNN